MAITSLTILSKNILKEQHTLIGFQFYLETFHPEYNHKDVLSEGIFNNIIDKIKGVGEKNKFKDFVTATGIALSKINSPEFKELLQGAFKEITSQGLSREQVISAFNEKEKVNEQKSKSFIGRIADFFDIETKYKAARNLILSLLIAAVTLKTNANAVNNTIAQDTVKIETQAKVNDASDDLKNIEGNHADVLKNQGVKLTGGINDIPDENTVKANVGINMDHGKGTQLDDKAQSVLDNLASEIAKSVKDTGKDVNIKIAGTVSNTTGDDEKATDTNQKLSDARAETTIKYLQAELEKQLNDSELSKVKIEKTKTEPVADQTQEKAGGDEASGALVHIETDVDLKAKLSWDNWPEAIRRLFKITPRNTTPGETPQASEPTQNAKKPADAPAPTSTPAPAPLLAPTEFGKLNRNGQIATVLASINPKLNIAQYKEIGPIKSYTDRQLMDPNIKDANARELAKLIINIRKNPNSLLSKVSKSTGIPLNVRAKAISTAPSKSTQAQLQSPTVKESIELFQEAFIDDIFTKLGVSNEDINTNKFKIISYLGSMYASEGNTDLSIVNTDKLNDEDKKQLQGLGFAPQAGNNYVFLKGRSAADVGAVRKIKPDVKRALDAVAQRKNELESYFNNIQNRKEFAGVIVGIIKYFEIRLQQDIAKLKGALQKLRTGNYIAEAINDPSSEIDVQKLIGKIEKNTFLVNTLKNISDEQELIQFLAGMSTYVTKVKPADKKGAFQDAENVLILLSKQNKPTGGTGQTNEMQRMQELAGIKTR
jgi:flagellar motor protein MotB